MVAQTKPVIDKDLVGVGIILVFRSLQIQSTKINELITYKVCGLNILSVSRKHIYLSPIHSFHFAGCHKRTTQSPHQGVKLVPAACRRTRHGSRMRVTANLVTMMYQPTWEGTHTKVG